MTIAHLTAHDQLAGQHADVSATPGPFGWAAIVIAGILGNISGLAQYNAIHTGTPDFLTALAFVIGGMVLGIGVGAAVGITIDKIVAWRRN
jgi:hypothetical protein